MPCFVAIFKCFLGRCNKFECVLLIVCKSCRYTAHNATNQQNQSFVTFQASTAQGVQTLYSLDIASTGTATAGVFRRGLLY